MLIFRLLDCWIVDLVIWLFGDLVIWGFGYLGICFLLLRSRGFFWNADETDLMDWHGFFLPQITQIFTNYKKIGGFAGNRNYCV